MFSSKQRDEAAIVDLFKKWAKAVRTRNLDGILANHSRDIVMFDVPPPLQSKGIEEYRRTWDLFFSWAQEPAVFDIVEMNVTAGEDVAFVTAIMRCAGREPAGEKTALQFRLTVGLRKLDDQWVVTHEHHSVPAT